MEITIKYIKKIKFQKQKIINSFRKIVCKTKYLKKKTFYYLFFAFILCCLVFFFKSLLTTLSLLYWLHIAIVYYVKHVNMKTTNILLFKVVFLRDAYQW